MSVRGYLFAPGTGRRLVVTQAALAAVIGLRIAFGPYLDFAGQPAALFRPVSFLHALDAMPGPVVILGLQVVGTLAAALAVAGWRRRATFPTAWLCLLVLAGLRSSRGKILHNDSLLLLAAVPFLLAPAVRLRDKAAGAAASVRFGWPVHTAVAVVAGVYFFSGLSKLTHSGTAWVTTDNMRYVLYEAAGAGKVAFPDIPIWLAGQAWLTHGLAAGILLLELTFPVVLLRRSRPSPVNAVYAGAAVAFHAGTWLILGLDYWAWAAVAVIVLPDWSPFVDRHLVTRLSRYRLGRGPTGRTAAGNQRAPADVVAIGPAHPIRSQKAEDTTCENAAAGPEAFSSPRSQPSPSS